MKFFRRLLSLVLALLLVSGIALPSGMTAYAAGSAKEISVKTQPDKTEYTLGEKLSLEGLTVKLQYIGGGTNTFTPAEFADKYITVTPAEGTVLDTEGKVKITVAHGELSDSFEVTVTKANTDVSVEKLSINTQPTDLEYTAGEKLSLAGLTVKLFYSNGESNIFTPAEFADKDITVTPAEGTVLDTEGKVKITVAHGELADSFEVTVTKANTDVSVEKLSINTQPTDLEYTAGEKLSLAGLTVKLHYSNGESNIFTPAEFADKDITVTPAEGTVLDTEGKVKITVAHGELADSFEVTVAKANTDVSVEKLSINTQPTDLEYTAGEKLSLAGLTVKLHYSNGESNIFTPAEFADKDITVTPAEGTVLDTEGKVKITVAHGELSDSFEVTVAKAESEGREIDRIFGSDRYETALAISAKGWQKAESVIIASGEDFADALAGTPLSRKLNAPILLVSKGDNSHVLAEIKRLEATSAFILGGENAVSSAVEKALKDSGIKVERLSGSDRYATAIAIAEKLGSGSDKAFVVSGESFADALSAGYAAAQAGSPILYTNAASLNAATGEYITTGGIKEVTVIGGPAAVSEETAAQLGKLAEVNRIGGEDRYLTSLAVARDYFDHTASDRVAVATGKDFPDALTGGAYAISLGMPVLLVGDKADDELVKYLDDCGITGITVFGGESALSSEAVDSLR